MKYQDLPVAARLKIADRAEAIDDSSVVILMLEEGFGSDGYFGMLYAIQQEKPIVLIGVEDEVTVPVEFLEYEGDKLHIEHWDIKLIKPWLEGIGFMGPPLIIEAEYETSGTRWVNYDLE